MIFKIHIQGFSHVRQDSVCRIEQIVFADVITWFYPFPLEYSPKRFGQIEMWRVWGKKEYEPEFGIRKALKEWVISVLFIIFMVDNQSVNK